MTHDLLFRFAVIGDTHVNPSDDSSTSPYKSQLLSNDRLRHTVETLNRLEPAFVMHVGDMVHPIPETEAYPIAARRFHEIVSALRAPIHLVPGNHDTGDKPADYVPAGSIREEFLDLYRSNFGEHYYSFDRDDCHFIVINTSLVNTGMAEEAKQADWLEKELSANAGRRCMLFMHYPPFVAFDQEHGHYDNLDEPGRSWFLNTIAERVECVFTGHVHNFFFNRVGRTDFFLMPSTAFVRADYSAVFQTGQPQSNERGRDDVPKLGLMVVDVYKDRVVPQFIRTYDSHDAQALPIPQRAWPLLAPQAGPMPSLGIDLREAWSDIYKLPYSSMLDEFRRKQARNDYLVLALWEMGVRSLRVPLDDLLMEDSRERMLALAASGARFTVFSFGVPDKASCEVLKEHAHLLDGVEFVLKWPIDGDATSQSLSSLRSTLEVPITISRFWNAAGASRGSKVVKLLVDHGFTDKDDVSAYVRPIAKGSFDRLVFRVSRSTAAREGIQSAIARAEELGARAQIHVRLADDGAAVEHMDDWENALRVAEAALCSHAHGQHRIFIDTLSDVDRGYFARSGLIDGTANPRLAGRILRNLNGALSELGPLQQLRWDQQGEVLVGHTSAPGHTIALVLPLNQSSGWSIRLPGDAAVHRARVVDLSTGLERANAVGAPNPGAALDGTGLSLAVLNH